MTLRAVSPVDTRAVRVLHLEDDTLDADLVQEFLQSSDASYLIDRVWSRDDFTHALTHNAYAIILADHQLPNFDGVSALGIARELAPDTPFIFVSGAFGEELAVEAMRHGATDYVVKQRLERLPVVVVRALAEAAEKLDRQRAEYKLRESEARLRATFENAGVGMVLIEPNGRIARANATFCRIIGRSRDDLAEAAWSDFTHPDDVSLSHSALEAVVTRAAPVVIEKRYTRGDGAVIWVRVTLSTTGVGQVLAVVEDVTARIAAEEAMRRLNETLEQRIVTATADREAILAKLHEAQRLETIGQLTGGFAHDFNNLLTPIIGNIDLLRLRLGLDPQEKLLRLVGNALQGAERAKTLVQRLLAFARRQVLEPRAVDVAKLVDGMGDFVARSIGPSIYLSIQAVPNLPAARVDPTQLELALLNLAVNSRDAMPRGGRLTISVDHRTVDADTGNGLRHGDYVRLSVSDSGSGMDAATLARAIEPFFSTKEIGKGTGLGLSMVHGLAAQSGGALFLSSTLGVGTRAEVWLPVANEQPERVGDLAPRPAQARRAVTVLLVDDEALVRTTTSGMLESLGHDVVEAASAAHALDLLRGGTVVDLVITDYLMPGMNGEELAREIRLMHPELPILLMTGYAALTGKTMADLPLLPKPFQQAELGATVERLVARPVAGQESVRPRIQAFD